jgi:hypothetical protein
MGALLGLLLPLVPGLIQGAEAIFAKPQSGTTKSAAVLAALRGMLGSIVAVNAPLADGKLPASIPVTDDALAGAIEAEFQRLKATGQLAPQPAAGTLYIMRGSCTPIL